MKGTIAKKSENESREISTPRCKVCGTNYEVQMLSRPIEGEMYEAVFRAPWPICSCGLKREKDKEKGKKEIKGIRKIKNCGIGKRYFFKTFSNMSGNKKAAGICRSWAKGFERNLKEGRGLFLTGNVGTGKTCLLAAIIDYIARIKKRSMWISIIYRNSISMLNEIRVPTRTMILMLLLIGLRIATS